MEKTESLIESYTRGSVDCLLWVAESHMYGGALHMQLDDVVSVNMLSHLCRRWTRAGPFARRAPACVCQ